MTGKKAKPKPTVQQVYGEALVACRDADRTDLMGKLLKHMADEMREASNRYVPPRCP